MSLPTTPLQWINAKIGGGSTGNLALKELLSILWISISKKKIQKLVKNEIK